MISEEMIIHFCKYLVVMFNLDNSIKIYIVIVNFIVL